MKGTGRIAILAGDGDMPLKVACALVEEGHEPFIVCLGGVIRPWAKAYEAIAVKWGEVGRLFNALSSSGCDRICLAGSVVRPDITSIRFDLGGLFSLPRILQAGFGGDDGILRLVISMFEEKGFRIVSVADIAPQLRIPADLSAGARAYEGMEKDIAVAREAFARFGPLDIGQGLVVIRAQVVAVEAAEGTDGLLVRVADMRKTGRIRARAGEGLFFKAAKPNQDMRVDLPTVGPTTVELAADAGLGAVVVEAERVITPDVPALMEAATKLKLHLASFSQEH